jgi:phasin
MTEAPTTNAKTKRAGSSVDTPNYGIPKFETPKLDLPNMEMPEAFREMIEKGVERTKDACDKAKVANEQVADLLENTYEAAVERATHYNHKLFEIARTNTRTAFDYIDELLRVKSPSDFIEISSAQIRKQFEIMSTQNKELCALAQEMATETAEKVTTAVSKVVNKAA